MFALPAATYSECAAHTMVKSFSSTLRRQGVQHVPNKTPTHALAAFTPQ